MVWLYSKHTDRFKKFNKFLHRFESFATNDKKIWNSFIKWSTLNESEALNCVKPFQLPMVHIDGKNISFNSPDCTVANAYFDPQLPANIYLCYSQTLHNYEATKDSGREHNFELEFRRLILHELVHWGRFKNNETDEYDRSMNDTGTRFEIEAGINKPTPKIPEL